MRTDHTPLVIDGHSYWLVNGRLRPFVAGGATGDGAGDPPPDGQGDPAAGDQQQQNQLGDAGQKAIAAERKARRDAEQKAKDLEARLAQLEDKDKTDTQRLTEQVTSLTQERDAAKASLDRLTIAIEKGLPEDLAKRVTGGARRIAGGDPDELASDAEDYFSTLGPVPGTDAGSGSTPPPSSRPQPKPLPGGGDPEAAPEETDLTKIGERMFRR